MTGYGPRATGSSVRRGRLVKGATNEGGGHCSDCCGRGVGTRSVRRRVVPYRLGTTTTAAGTSTTTLTLTPTQRFQAQIAKDPVTYPPNKSVQVGKTLC